MSSSRINPLAALETHETHMRWVPWIPWASHAASGLPPPHTLPGVIASSISLRISSAIACCATTIASFARCSFCSAACRCCALAADGAGAAAPAAISDGLAEVRVDRLADCLDLVNEVPASSTSSSSTTDFPKARLYLRRALSLECKSRSTLASSDRSWTGSSVFTLSRVTNELTSVCVSSRSLRITSRCTSIRLDLFRSLSAEMGLSFSAIWRDSRDRANTSTKVTAATLE
mmetsp:Transcript_73861/g.164147  ORF Transcript_73861/g.164147 Transcript_73861/m.164147 type:complete len:232 (+) Transcript_73861:503-1198(+)